MFFKCPHCGKRSFLPSTRNHCEQAHIAYFREQMKQVVYAENYPGRPAPIRSAGEAEGGWPSANQLNPLALDLESHRRSTQRVLRTERPRSASQRPDLRQARSRAHASDPLLDPMSPISPFNPMNSMGGSETAGHSHRSDPKPDCDSRNYDPSPSYQDNDSGGCGDSSGD